MNILGGIQAVFGLLAVGYGVMVMRGVLRVSLSGERARRFLKYSLIASLAGLLPLTHHLSLSQGICMLSVYCSAVVVLACLKFHLAGIWRTVFAFSITVVLYLNVVSLLIQLFNRSHLFATATSVAYSVLEITQFLLAAFFVVLEVLAVRKCHVKPAHLTEGLKVPVH
ncbi:MAG TPA: hypothetical protein VJX73_01285 [Terracidiphilus sp.]|nr:hypothetical protein [Terracidiphilus sp.]